jgi:site-specific recombinase XerD
MVQLKVLLDARTKKSDGTHSIYYRITEKKKVFYLSTGFSIEAKYWDDAKSIIKKAYPNAQSINSSINKRYFEIQKAIIELEDEGVFSMDSLKNRLAPKQTQFSFKQFSEIVIQELYSNNRVGNAVVYQTGVNSIFRYKPSKELRFTDISVQFLEGYKQFLLNNGCKINTIGNYLRSIRAIYNIAIKRKIVDKKYYPFDEVSIKYEKTAKRAISKDDIDKLRRYYVRPETPEWYAKNFFLLSFNLIGASFTDMAYLKPSNIVKDRIVYKRRKTHKLYNIKLTPEAEKILNLYYPRTYEYLLPVLPSDIKEDSVRSKAIIQQWIKTTNKYLQRLSKKAGIDAPITTYVARHTWATTAKRLGYSNELIAEAMGHEYGNKITNMYLDAFDKEVVDEVNFKVTQ